VLDSLVGRPDLDEAGAAEVRAVIVATGALDRTERMIRTRTRAARAALASAPVTPAAAEALTSLATSAVDRDR
jgi:geranylgeranyl diphosphate synthase type I